MKAPTMHPWIAILGLFLIATVSLTTIGCSSDAPTKISDGGGDGEAEGDGSDRDNQGWIEKEPKERTDPGSDPEADPELD